MGGRWREIEGWRELEGERMKEGKRRREGGGREEKEQGRWGKEKEGTTERENGGGTKIETKTVHRNTLRERDKKKKNEPEE